MQKTGRTLAALLLSAVLLTACADDITEVPQKDTGSAVVPTEQQGDAQPLPELNDSVEDSEPTREQIPWDEAWEYAEYSVIHSDSVTLYKVSDDSKTIAVNAGHGTEGGESVQTQCHPDGSPKVTGGSTGAGAIYATAVASGMTMLDGTPEAVLTLQLSEILKDKLLENGFNVLMLRDAEDVQLDNIARTVFANEHADCHLAIHYDSTDSDKGFFYISVPDVASYRSMEPVASHWKEHHALGDAILNGMRTQNVKIFSEGSMAIDLTQTSYSAVPSVDLEVGDAASDHSAPSMEVLANGIVEGIERYFEE